MPFLQPYSKLTNMFYYYNGFSLIRKYGICMMTVYAQGRFKVTDRRSRVPFLWTRMTFQHEKPREIASTDTNDRFRFAANRVGGGG